MEKWHRLAVLGSIAFVLVFFGMLFSGGFFDRSLARRLVLSESVSGSEEGVFIGNDGFNVSELVISPNTLFVLRVVNNDNKVHNVILFEETSEGEFEIIDQGFVELGAFWEVKLLNYNKEEELGAKKLFSDNLLLSCVTCSGETQVSIVAKKQ